MPVYKRDPFGKKSPTLKHKYLLSQDWYPANISRAPTSKVESLILRGDNTDQELLQNIMIDDKDIPPGNFNDIYVLKNKKWEKASVKCRDCGKLLSKPDLIKKHPAVCKHDLININEDEEDTEMPIQRVQKNGETYYRYGMHGKLYKNRADAEKQAQAIHASGYKEPTNKKKD